MRFNWLVVVLSPLPLLNEVLTWQRWPEVMRELLDEQFLTHNQRHDGRFVYDWLCYTVFSHPYCA